MWKDDSIENDANEVFDDTSSNAVYSDDISTC